MPRYQVFIMTDSGQNRRFYNGTAPQLWGSYVPFLHYCKEAYKARKVTGDKRPYPYTCTWGITAQYQKLTIYSSVIFMHIFFTSLTSPTISIFSIMKHSWCIKRQRHRHTWAKQTSDRHQIYASVTTLIARFMGPTWGPSGADRTQGGPVLAPWALLSGQSN